jgi:exodeoxyribonuclease-3
MRIATWNVNSLKARLEKVEWWLERARPDVLLMQETKLTDDDAPLLPFRMAGYDLVHHGEGRWNGVAIAVADLSIRRRDGRRRAVRDPAGAGSRSPRTTSTRSTRRAWSRHGGGLRVVPLRANGRRRLAVLRRQARLVRAPAAVGP